MNEKTNLDSKKIGLTKSGIKTIFQLYLFLISQAILFFISSGNFNVPRAWTFFGLTFFYVSILAIILICVNPELINQRGQIKPDTKPWDKIFFAVYIPMGLILLVVAGLDVGRFRWVSANINISILGIILHTIAAFIGSWSMVINTHFETTVRIQNDRDHKVITSGPYKIVRHPGYTAGILLCISTPLIIGSIIALIPASVIIIAFLIRTILEDNTLQNELNGYSEYAERVRYKLFPRIW